MRARAKVFLAAATVAAVSGCSEDPVGPQAGEPFELAPAETAWLEPVAVTVRFAAVEDDSRCPRQAQCVWPGDGAVSLEVVPTTGEPTTVVLHTNPTVGPGHVQLSAWELRLAELHPYPEGESIPGDAYRITLVLEKR